MKDFVIVQVCQNNPCSVGFVLFLKSLTWQGRMAWEEFLLIRACQDLRKNNTMKGRGGRGKREGKIRGWEGCGWEEGGERKGAGGRRGRTNVDSSGD